MEKLNWRRAGIKVDADGGASRYLQELHFADDILLFARSRNEAVKMLEDLSREATKDGLEVHFDKTKILSNRMGQQHISLEVLGNKVDFLPRIEALSYLGRKVCM